MPAPLILANNARLVIRYSVGEFLSRVRPFIEDVAWSVAQTGNIADSVSQAIDERPEMLQYFVVEPSDIASTFGLKEEYLFSRWEPHKLLAAAAPKGLKVDVQSIEFLRSLQAGLACGSSGTCTRVQAARLLDDISLHMLDTLIDAGIVIEGNRRIADWAAHGVAGIYRLQHASLLYRSPTTGILVDPHFHSSYGRAITSDVYRDQLEGKVDAILISHFHEDHWFFATLLMFPRDTRIVVPKVPVSSVICGDMQSLLARCGFTNVIAVEWDSPPLRIGDCEVHVLPFYGEQPLRFDRARDERVRNWGNTYVVRTPQYTSWFLIDSGSDAKGSMIEVAEKVRQRIGRVDIVLSNLRTFNVHGPLYINGGLNWLTLSPAQIRDFSSMTGHSITLGPSGVADVCTRVNARVFLPYAHWWGEVGAVADSNADTPDQDELPLLQELTECISARGGSTRVVHWNVGDGMICGQQNALRRVPMRAA